LPVGETLGAVSGVDVDAQNHVYVFHRSGRQWPENDVLDLAPIARPTITVFEGDTGKIVKRFGDNLFAMPHGLTVDRKGSLWLTDVALQQVFKYSRDGTLQLTLGERGVPGNDTRHFNRPTGVAVAADGSFYLSDGYLNTRVMKFARDGRFLFQWGTPGSGPGQFDLPHGIALASRRIYVADRSNARVQIFDTDGSYVDQWKNRELGRPYAIAFDKDGRSFIADGGDQPKLPPDRSALVIRDANGAETRVGRYGNYDGEFEMAHDIATGPDGAVYVGDITGGRIQKFVSA
jgi:peptidylamidoglycolate lyase